MVKELPDLQGEIVIESGEFRIRPEWGARPTVIFTQEAARMLGNMLLKWADGFDEPHFGAE